MATGIEQKLYKALFPLWGLKKRYIEINTITQRKAKSIGKNLDIHAEL